MLNWIDFVFGRIFDITKVNTNVLISNFHELICVNELDLMWKLVRLYLLVGLSF